jgi:AraC family transcriptional regulator
MSMNSPALKLQSFAPFPADRRLAQTAPIALANVHHLPVRRPDVGSRPALQAPAIENNPAVEVSPKAIVNRRRKDWAGIRVETLEVTRRQRIEMRFRAPVHLLVVVEQGVRRAGDTVVDGLRRSTVRELTRKMTFVPAGHDYYEWQEPSLLLRATLLYFDPAKLMGHFHPNELEALRTPRLLFEDAGLWETALKLRRLMETADSDSEPLLEALGAVLAHELARPVAVAEPRARGGLAGWQQRAVTAYIEENLAEPIPLAKLAGLVQLSPYHFCRAFKQSFGIPPHRYHTSRRIERAKQLLAKPDYSVTDIGLTVGFSETSSFTAAFRKATGLTPTAYHRSLD